jgi:hypothetical protein
MSVLFSDASSHGTFTITNAHNINLWNASAIGGTVTIHGPAIEEDLSEYKKHDTILEENLDYIFPPSETTRRHRKEVRATDIERPSIYLLIDQMEIEGQQVVYVGQSVKPYARMSQHLKDKFFTHIRVMPCRRDRMNYWEKKLIQAFKPEYNRTHNPKRR